MKSKIKIFSKKDVGLLLAAFVLGLILLALPFLEKNNQAVLYMVQKKYEKAEQLLLESLGENSFSPRYRMNLAFNYNLWGKKELALKEYEVTRNLIKKEQKTKEVAFIFFSLFNSATSVKKILKALDFYQQALELQPNSIEIKTNIELLLQAQSKSDKEDKEDKKNKSNKEQKEQQKEKQNKKGESEQPSEQKKEQPAEQKKQKIDQKQTEALLKAILEQEKKIRERRQKDKKGKWRTSPVQKDW